MEKIELRGAAAGTVAHHLDSLAEVSMRDLQAAVANMAERIASLERVSMLVLVDQHSGNRWPSCW